MKRVYVKILICFILFAFSNAQVLADDYSKAEKYLRKAQNARIKEESYEYIDLAREIYLKKYEETPTDIKTLVGLSKTYQLLGDRAEAKLYLLKAYNMKPYDAKLQREMAEFHVAFQEYSTAIEYYKLSLASGLLKDFDTNLATAKCYEKLGDLENAELYYQICYHLDSNSKKVKNKINEYTSAKYPDNTQELEDAKYKYLFKDRPVSEQKQIENEAEEIIDKMNFSY